MSTSISLHIHCIFNVMTHTTGFHLENFAWGGGGSVPTDEKSCLVRGLGVSTPENFLGFKTVEIASGDF